MTRRTDPAAWPTTVGDMRRLRCGVMHPQAGRSTHVRIRAVASALATAVAIATVGLAPAAKVHAAVDGYQALSAPQRLLDTRPGQTTVDGQSAGVGANPAGNTLRLTVAGRATVPVDARSVMLNVTVTEPSGYGFVTVFACGVEPPSASNLNFAPRQTVPNAVVASIGESGQVCVYSSTTTHLIVDVAGWFPESAYTPLPAPARLLDTRPGEATADGAFAGIGVRAPGSTLELSVSGRAGLAPVVDAVVLNVTVTGPTGAGFVTVFPCDAAQPTASNLNYAAGQTVPNLVITRVSANGTVCLFTLSAAHLVVDVSGTLPSATFTALASPRRVLDTRPGEATADGASVGDGTQPGGGSLQLDVGGRVDIPETASAVVLNVTVVGPKSPGFVTVHPRGSERPTASNLNHLTGGVVPNLVVARLGSDGRICLFTSAPTDLIVDVAGWLSGPPPASGTSDCPSTTPSGPTSNADRGLVRRADLQVALGADLVAVWACDVPGGSVVVDPTAVAQWADANVVPWFQQASRGRYAPDFEAHPTGRLSAANSSECLRQAESRTGAPFTNVLVVDTSTYGGGFGGPGVISSDPSRNTPVMSGPPSRTSRGVYVGGGSVVTRPSPMVVVHEIGHSLHWPHSFIGPTEYDNPVDVMSGQPVYDYADGPSYFCRRTAAGGGFTYWGCNAQNTLAFNRVAAGWVDAGQVAVHRSGRALYSLDRPLGDGVQMVAMPDPGAPLRMLVIEARPRTGFDQSLLTPGVAIHVIDQTPSGLGGLSTNRPQRQAIGTSDSYGHVLGVGQWAVVGGVRIEVRAVEGAGYRVLVAGSYHPG